MLYVHGKQLWSCLDGQLPNHTVPAQYLVPNLSSVTNNLLFLNQRKSEIIFLRKYVPGARIGRGTADCQVDALLTYHAAYRVMFLF